MYVTDQPLQIEFQPRGQTLICKLTGSATMEICDLLCKRLAEGMRTEPKLLVIDLSELEFICSLGLGGIVATHVHARRHGGKVVLVAPVPAVRELLEVTRLDTLMAVFDTMAEALPA